MGDATAVVQAIWDRIHNWMANNFDGDMLKLLRPGVSEKQIKELEEKLEGTKLPEDFVASYRIHNGSTARYFWGSVLANSFFSIDEIFDAWVDKKLEFADFKNLNIRRTDMDPKEVKTRRWSNGWIPFGSDKLGHLLCIDLDPTKKGKCGQVIQWYADENSLGNFTDLRLPSFAGYLNEFATALENNSIFCNPNYTSFIWGDLVDGPNDYHD